MTAGPLVNRARVANLALSGATPAPPSQTIAGTIYIDPQDASGGASDRNTGANPTNSPPGTGPLLTTAHLNTVIAGKTATGAVTLAYLSEDTSGTFLDLALSMGTFDLSVNMALVTVHTGGTIDAGTVAVNPSAANGGQRQVLHASDVADWTPFVIPSYGGTATHCLRVVDSVTGGTAWLTGVGAPSGTSTASCGRPWNAATTAPTALTIGNGYTLVRGGALTVGSVVPQMNGGTLSFDGCEFPAASIGPISDTLNITYSLCAFLGTCFTGGVFSNCGLAAGGSGKTTIELLGGFIDPTRNSGLDTLILLGDVWVGSRTGQGLLVGGLGALRQAFVSSAGLGDSGAQFQDCRGANRAGAMLNAGGNFVCSGGLMWGSHNDGFGVLVGVAAHYWMQASTSAPTVTGTSGDFGFFATTDPTSPTIVNITMARAWDPSAGAYTEAGSPATRATTWANLLATIGSGGFFGHACCLETDGHIVLAGRKN